MSRRPPTNASSPPLDEAAIAALAIALPPIDPPPERAAALRDRVLAIARPDPARDYVTVPDDGNGWQPLIDRIQVKILFESETHRFALYRLEPGAVFPGHTHPYEEECLVLEGDLSVGDIRMEAGDFQYARRGTVHAALRSQHGALVYLRHAIASRPL